MKGYLGILSGLVFTIYSGEALAEADDNSPMHSFKVMNCTHPSLPTRRLEVRYYSSNGLPCNALYFKDGSSQLIGWAKSTSGICEAKFNKVQRTLTHRGGFTCLVIEEGTNASFDQAAPTPEVAQESATPLAVRGVVPDWVIQTPPPWE